DYLVVVVRFLWRRAIELARRTNRVFAGVGPRKPGGFVPVQVVDRVRVFHVWLVIVAREDLRLLCRPASTQSRNLRALFPSRFSLGRSGRRHITGNAVI